MQRQGFTLIEVMVAVVILAVGMASLFTSEAGAVRIAQRARTTTIATLLARCKMGEIEERIYKEGWPGEQIDGRDECCDEAEHEGFKCEWKVERIVLPELSEEGETGGMTAGGDKKEKLKERGSELAEKGAGGALGGSSPAGGALGGGLGDAGVGGDGGILEGFMSQFSDNEEVSDPIASMAMQLAFPVLKPVIEEGVRRATVTVTWKEGDSDQTFDVVQYLVNEAQSALTEQQTEAIQDLGGTGGTGGTASGGTAGKTNQPGGGTPGGGAR
jgi:general secretion pathway protein I